MNMTSVLHRRHFRGAHETTQRRAGESTSSMPSEPSPPVTPPTSVGDRGPGGAWPVRAKVLVAVLLVAAVVSTAAAAVAARGDRDDRGEEVRRLQDRVASLTVERDDAIGDVAALDAEIATLRAELDNARAELEDARAGGEESAARIAELEADVTAVTQERADALAAVADLTVERDGALAAIAGLEGDVADLTDDVATLRDQLAKAIVERNALAAAKTPKFDVSLKGVKVAGSYTAKVTDVYGTTTKFTKLDLTTTKEGWLRVSIPGVAEGGLSMADGVLHTATGSTTAVPACAGLARTAQVVISIVPSGYEVGNAGAEVTGLNALVTVAAPATGSCPAVLSYATAELARLG